MAAVLRLKEEELNDTKINEINKYAVITDPVEFNTLPSTVKYVKWDDTLRGGDFTLSGTPQPDDDVIWFNGYCRDGYAVNDINANWAGVISGNSSLASSNTQAFERLRAYCKTYNKKALLSDGTYYISEPLVIDYSFVGQSRNNTKIIQSFDFLKYGDGELYATYDDMVADQLETRTQYHYSDDTKDLFTYQTPKKAIVQVNNVEGIIVSNFQIVGTYDNIIRNDSDLNLILPITGLSTVSFNNNNKLPDYYFNRSYLSNIKVRECYQLFYLNGWVSDFKDLLGIGGYLGLRAYGFNGNKVELKLESVQIPLDLHESANIEFENFMTEGSLTQKPAIFSRCQNIVFNSWYQEATTINQQTNGAVAEVGVRTANNPPYASMTYMKCFNIEFNNVLPGITANGVPFFITDVVENITISGTFQDKTRPIVQKTVNSINVIEEKISNRYIFKEFKSLTTNTSAAPINFSVNPQFKHGFSGFYKIDYDATSTIINSDGDIRSPFGGNMVKIVSTGVGSAGISVISKHIDYPDYIKIGDTITVGSLVYIPKITEHDTYRPLNTIYVGSDTNAVGWDIPLDKWAYVTVEVVVTADVLTINNIWKITSSTTPIDAVMYLASFDIINGNDEKLKDMMGMSIYNSSGNPFCVDMGAHIHFNNQPSYYQHTNIGDTYYKTPNVTGESSIFECVTPGSTVDTWVGRVPSSLPTTAGAVGTWWLNNGVLTQVQ